MERLFQCEICEHVFGSEQDALDCESQGSNPLHKIGDKVRYWNENNGPILTISKASIVPMSHSFIYGAYMLSEDNPGRTLCCFGWISEDKLFSHKQKIAA